MNLYSALTKTFYKVIKKVQRDPAAIFSLLGCVGVIATGVTSAKAAVEKEKDGKWEHYIPPAVVGAGTVVCILCSNGISKKKQLSLAAAYSLVNKKYSLYQNKVKETFGEEAHEQIIKSLDVEKARNVYISAETFGLSANGFDLDDEGETRLFYDEFSDRYFQSTFAKVLQAELHLNRNFLLKGVQSLNDFYEFLGLEKTDEGDWLGWSNIQEYYWIDFNHRKVDIDEGLSCYVIEMMFTPDSNYLDDF